MTPTETVIFRSSRTCTWLKPALTATRGIAFVVATTYALPAKATCTVEPGDAVGSYIANIETSSATNNDTTASFPVGTFPAGTTVIVGTSGLTGTRSGGDTFLRLFDEYGEVAYNDDACDGLGSRIVYTVPQGWRTLYVRAGCFAGASCSGAIARWIRLDSNGYLSDVINHGYNQIVMTDTSKILRSKFHNSAPISHSYEECGFFGGECFSHFQGIQRLYRPFSSDNAAWFVLSGSNSADLMFGYPGGGGIRAMDRTWKENGSIYDGALASTQAFGEVMAPSRHLGNHLGAIQQTGNYVLGGLQKYDGTAEPMDAGRVMLFDIGNPWGAVKKWDINHVGHDGAGNVRNFASSDVAITKHRDGTILLAVAQGDERTIDFFQKDADEYTTTLTSPLAYPLNASGKVGFADIESPSGWNLVSTLTKATNNAGVPPFNNIDLFTQCDGSMYLMGTRVTNGKNSTFYGRLSSGKTVANWPAERAGFVCRPPIGGIAYPDECDFKAAAGFYADALSDRMYLYSSAKYLGDPAPDNYVGLSEFGSTLAPVTP